MVPGPPKSCQTEPKMDILAPSWPILGATCCQLGPSCVHLGPIFAPTSPKISTKSQQKSPEAPPETPRPPRGSPEGSRIAPGIRICIVLGSILDLIFVSSQAQSSQKKLSLLADGNVSYSRLSMSSAVSPLIIHGLSASSSRHVAAWRAQRIGYPPPPPKAEAAFENKYERLWQNLQILSKFKSP